MNRSRGVAVFDNGKSIAATRLSRPFAGRRVVVLLDEVRVVISTQVLIAVSDDDAVHEIRASLSALDCDVTVVDRDSDAVAVIQQTHPQLVLVGVQEDCCDHLDWVKTIKNESIVIAVVNLSDADAIGRSIEAGVDDFVTMPIERREVSNRIARILELHDSFR
ncbi:MAG: response regulator [Planctomycetota bacterium]